MGNKQSGDTAKTRGPSRREMWYGVKNRGNFLVYSDLDTKYVEIFNRLRSGEIPDLELKEKESPPDLLPLLISYGKIRIREEFTEDQYIRKIYSMIPDILLSINLIYEKVSDVLKALDPEYGNAPNPCVFFSRIIDDRKETLLGESLTRISETALSLCNLRDYLMKSISESINRVMPNTSALVGEELASELLYRAGSLKALAFMPASSIQVMGSEKALFKHISHGGPSPKHGVIFKYKGLASLKPRQRGKVSRVLACKIAITSRADYRGTIIDTSVFKEKVDKTMSLKK